LKAGTIGQLQIKLNYFQMFDKRPVEIIVKELFIIIGPNLMQRSNDDSFVSPQEDLIAPYDDNNCYHIWSNTLTIKNRP
jgi:hypothetical protein